MGRMPNIIMFHLADWAGFYFNYLFFSEKEFDESVIYGDNLSEIAR